MDLPSSPSTRKKNGVNLVLFPTLHATGFIVLLTKIAFKAYICKFLKGKKILKANYIKEEYYDTTH